MPTLTPRLFAATLLALGPVAAPALAGDAAAGSENWRNCRSCHAIVAPDGETIQRGGGRGPNLWGIAGRPVAGVEGFRYSASLIDYGQTGAVWGPENFVAFVANPTGYLREVLQDSSARSEMGHRMVQGADDMWAYLESITAD